jgi:hypothetical protein
MGLGNMIAIWDLIQGSGDRSKANEYIEGVRKAVESSDPVELEKYTMPPTGFYDPSYTAKLQTFATPLIEGAYKKQARKPLEEFRGHLNDPEFGNAEAQSHLAERSGGWGKGYEKNPYVSDGLNTLAEGARNNSALTKYIQQGQGGTGPTPFEMARYANSTADADNKLINFTNLNAAPAKAKLEAEKTGLEIAKKQQDIDEGKQKERWAKNYSDVVQPMAMSFLQPNQGRQGTGQFDDAKNVLENYASLTRDYPIDPTRDNALRNDLSQQMDKGMETDPRKYVSTKVGKDTVTMIPNRYGLASKKLDKDTAIEVKGGGTTVVQSTFVDPVSGKPLVFDKKTNTYKVANVEGSGAIAPRPTNPSASEREGTAKGYQLQDQIAEIRNLYKPEYVGWAQGPLGKMTSQFSSEETKFRRVTDSIKDTLLRMKSGAQINEQEYERLAKLTPTYNGSDENFLARLEGFETEVNTVLSARARAQREGGVVTRGNGKNTPQGQGKRPLPKF